MGFLILLLFSSEAFAKCQSESMVRQDRAIFMRRLDMVKERVSGYEQMRKKAERFEKMRLKGIAAHKAKRLRYEKMQLANARAYSAIRKREEQAREHAMLKGFAQYEREQRAYEEKMRCSREAYLKARAEVQAKEERILHLTEEQELMLLTR